VVVVVVVVVVEPGGNGSHATTVLGVAWLHPDKATPAAITVGARIIRFIVSCPLIGHS